MVFQDFKGEKDNAGEDLAVRVGVGGSISEHLCVRTLVCVCVRGLRGYDP